VFGKLYGNQDTDEQDDELRTFQSTLQLDESFLSRGILNLPSSRESAFMYKYTTGYLQSKNYEHYEISSYALKQPLQCVMDDRLSPHESSDTIRTPSYRSEHNQIYWGYNTQWYALGLGATSFVQGRILARPRTMMDYMHWVSHPSTQPKSRPSDQESFVEGLESVDSTTTFLEPDLMDIVLKRLRTSDGLSLHYVQQRYGTRYVEAIQKGIQLGLNVDMVSVDRNNTIRLTDPTGFLYSNSIISNIFYEIDLV
jgi:coproporphyrinogen III oxidase-like Fe-S oxidoreductase